VRWTISCFGVSLRYRFGFWSRELVLLVLILFFFFRGAFDISLIASIASHLTYWGDEDVNHFMLSQMLSRKARHRLKGGSAVDKLPRP
jgi:hypothetical protein